MSNFCAKRRLENIVAHGLCFLFAALLAMAGDWPAYRHDVQRSSATEAELQFPMKQVWCHTSAQLPTRAWSPAIHVMDRLDFDCAPHPIVANGLVYYASTADDTIRALDLDTGAEKWHFVTGGPVRLAPQVARGKLYAGSDDGYAYCLDAANGKLLWKFRPGPGDDMVVGNRRMISRWPLRSGVLVVDDIAYLAAGMWNAEGIHICALNADTGDVVWRNDTAGYLGMFYKGTANVREVFEPEMAKRMSGNHEGEFGVIGLTPQGALLAYEDVLVIPNGSAFPARFSRLTGKFMPWPFVPGYAPYGAGGTAGGTWATIDDGLLYTLYKYRDNALRPFAYQVSDTVSKFRRVVARPIPNISNLPAVLYDPSGVVAGFPAVRSKGYTHDRGKASIVVKDGKLYGAHAYDLVMAGDKLVLGLDGVVAVEEVESGKEIWRAPVNGVAREIAVAGGRIIISTESGTIHCFAPADVDAPAIPSDSSVQKNIPSYPDVSLLAPVISQLEAGGMDRGYALVLGDDSGSYSVALARATKLKMINALADQRSVTTLRNDLLARTKYYGSRIHVLPLSRLDELPFARYFANAVIIAGPSTTIPPAELYRVLRPYGGMLFVPGATTETVAALQKGSGATASEFGRGGCLIRRGPLEGALDPGRSVISDKLVAGPMRLLWFGGPKVEETQGIGEGMSSPTIMEGSYMVFGEDRCSAVDIYNGAILWSHVLPRSHRNLYKFNGIIYQTNEPEPLPLARRPNNYKPPRIDRGGYPRMNGEGLAQLALGLEPNEIWFNFDPHTGEQKMVLGRWEEPEAFSLQSRLEWPVGDGTAPTGTIAITATANGLELVLTTMATPEAGIDCWNLNFDFRPLERRCGLYEHGVFQLLVTPARDGKTAGCSLVNGPRAPQAVVKGEALTKGAKTMLKLSWDGLTELLGGRPDSFGFSATLNWTAAAGEGRIERFHLFGDWSSDALNYGWPNIFIGAAPARTPPPLCFTELTPANRRILGGRRVPIRAQSTDNPGAYGPRVHPLTGDLEPKIYRSGNGPCGLPVYSDSSRFGRAVGMLGLYDFLDDSGLRTFSGVKAGCTTDITPALGVLVVSPEGSHCVCTYPYPSVTVTLATADKRLNEDWAIFHDRDADTMVRQAAINMGAFGDRRDKEGTLWLGFPRVAARGYSLAQEPGQEKAMAPSGVWLTYAAPAMTVPLRVEFIDPANSFNPENDVDVVAWHRWFPNRDNSDYGPYRINTDITPIAATDRPWLYGSMYRGLKRATMELDFRTNLIARTANASPMIDGTIGTGEWGDVPDAFLPFTKTRLFLLHDNANLYIAMQREAVVDRLGRVAPWQKSARGDDAEIWVDDSCELFLNDQVSGAIIHLGVSASGARFDALVNGHEEKLEDAGWNGEWKSATSGDETQLAFELAIPLSTLAAAGLRLENLGLNAQMNQKDISAEVNLYGFARVYDRKFAGPRGEALSYLGPEGRQHCRNFMPLGIGKAPQVLPRRFNVRLHFAELDGARPGERVFDVKIQGQTVIKGLDVVKEAGGEYRALVKEVNGVLAGGELTVEFVPAATKFSKKNAPILNALELREEGFEPPRLAVAARQDR